MRRSEIAFLVGLVGLASLPLAAPAAAQAPRQSSLTLYDQPDYRGGSVTFYGDNANIGSTGFADRARSAQVRGSWRLCEGGGYRNRCEVLSANVGDLDTYGLAGRVGSAQLLGGGPSAGYEPPAPYRDSAPRAQPPAGDDARDRPYAEARPTYPGVRRPPAAPYASAPPQSYADRYAPPEGDRGYRDDLPPPARDASRSGYPPTPRGRAMVDDDRGVEGAGVVFFPRPTLGGRDIAGGNGRAADSFCRSQGLGAAVYVDQNRRSRQAVDMDGRPAGEGPVLSDVLCRR